MTTQPELGDTTQLTSYRDGDPTLALSMAEALVRGHCGWHIAPSRTEDVVVDGSGTTVLGLPTLHLTDLVSVTANGTAVPLEEVEWSAAGYLVRPAGWGSRARGVLATITHGYSEVPPEVQGVVLSIAARVMASPDGAVRQQVGQVSVTYTQAGFNALAGLTLLDHEQAVLSRHTIPPGP